MISANAHGDGVDVELRGESQIHISRQTDPAESADRCRGTRPRHASRVTR
jgi:hypothetical protein